MGILDAMQSQVDIDRCKAYLEDKGAEAVSVNPTGNLNEVLGQDFVRKNVRQFLADYPYFSFCYKGYSQIPAQENVRAWQG